MSDSIHRYYDEYGKRVYLYLVSLCNDSDMAEELTQETFYQAIKSLDSYKGKSSVYSWLCGIAKNLWFKELDRQKRHPVANQDENIPAEGLPVEEYVEIKDTTMQVLRQIHKLPEIEKEIMLLRATGALSFREIAEVFGKTENWARVTYYRAKQKIKI